MAEARVSQAGSYGEVSGAGAYVTLAGVYLEVGPPEAHVSVAGVYGEVDYVPPVAVTTAGTYAETQGAGILVTQAGVYGELVAAEVRGSQASVYGEVAGTATFATQAGSYGELLPPQTVVLDGWDLSKWVTEYGLTCEDVPIITLNLASTGYETRRDLKAWTVEVTGMWTEALDNWLGRRVLRARNRHSLEVWFEHVVYQWAYVVAVSGLTVESPVDGITMWRMTLHCSGTPERHDYTP